MKIPNFAVVLVDMQFFFVEWILSEERKTMIQAQLAVIRLCRELDIQLVVLEYTGWGDTISPLREELLLCQNVIFLEKDWQDGFLFSELENALNRLSLKNLFFMGVNANGCVRATASTAIKKGCAVYTHSSVIAQKHGQDKNLNWYQENTTLLEFSQLLNK